MTTKTNRVGRGEESKLEANAIAWVGGYVRVGEGIKQVVLAMVKASSATESAPDTGWASVGRMKHLRRSSLAVAVFRAVGCARLGGRIYGRVLENLLSSGQKDCLFHRGQLHWRSCRLT